MSTPWRIVLEVDADSRELAESLLLRLVASAQSFDANGGADEFSGPDAAARVACGDPGLAHSPTEADLSLAGGREALECESEGSAP